MLFSIPVPTYTYNKGTASEANLINKLKEKVPAPVLMDSQLNTGEEFILLNPGPDPGVLKG